MSSLDLPAPRPDGCGDGGAGDDEWHAAEGGGVGEEGGATLAVRLPSATHRVQQPGSLTPAHMSNRLGR